MNNQAERSSKADSVVNQCGEELCSDGKIPHDARRQSWLLQVNICTQAMLTKSNTQEGVIFFIFKSGFYIHRNLDILNPALKELVS